MALVDDPDAASLVAGEAASLATAIGGRVVVVHAVASEMDATIACWGLGWEAAWWTVSVQPGSDSGVAYEVDDRKAVAMARRVVDAAGVEHSVDRRWMPQRASQWGRRRAVAALVVASAGENNADVIVLRDDGRCRSRDVATMVRRRVTIPVVTVGAADQRSAVLS